MTSAWDSRSQCHSACLRKANEDPSVRGSSASGPGRDRTCDLGIKRRQAEVRLWVRLRWNHVGFERFASLRFSAVVGGLCCPDVAPWLFQSRPARPAKPASECVSEGLWTWLADSGQIAWLRESRRGDETCLDTFRPKLADTMLATRLAEDQVADVAKSTRGRTSYPYSARSIPIRRLVRTLLSR